MAWLWCGFAIVRVRVRVRVRVIVISVPRIPTDEIKMGTVGVPYCDRLASTFGSMPRNWVEGQFHGHATHQGLGDTVRVENVIIVRVRLTVGEH